VQPIADKKADTDYCFISETYVSDEDFPFDHYKGKLQRYVPLIINQSRRITCAMLKTEHYRNRIIGVLQCILKQIGLRKF
jgi:hypothetical protein